ncbi:MAG: hypothetical protein QOJ62_1033, partial [Actinomycetota bacterium]|nr:hypothetical protein [Actinomycetota bacterium]
MGSDLIVLRAGGRTRADGRVVAAGGAITFEPPLPTPLVGYLPGQDPVRPASSVGVPVEGVDLNLLARRHEKDGAIEGWAHISGVWSGDRLRVDAQRPKDPIDFDNRRPLPDWASPPCPPPPGGWPHGLRDENLDIEDLRDAYGHWPADGPIVALTLFRPGPTQVVAVVAASDPHRV